MTRRALLVMTVVALSGCVGEVAATAEELARYEFVAQVVVSPASPVPGRQLSFNLELTSRSNQLVNADIVLRAVRADGSVLHEQVWSGVKVHPEEVWNLTQGFIAGTSERGEVKVVVEVRETQTRRPLWQGEGPRVSFIR